MPPTTAISLDDHAWSIETESLALTWRQTDAGAGFPFGILGTPSAIMIDADGMIASPAATGASWLGLLNSRADHSLERETREVRRPQDMITQEYDAMLPMAIHERVMRHQGARRERFTRGYQGR